MGVGVLIPTQREFLHHLLGDALADWRTSHGEARERARYELRSVIHDMKSEVRRQDEAFRRAVAKSKQRSAVA